MSILSRSRWRATLRAPASAALALALFGPAAGAQAHTSWTPKPVMFTLTANWDKNTVDGNRQMSAQVWHTDASSPCTPIYEFAITDSAYAAGSAAHKWVSIPGGKCDFGSSGISTGQFYMLATMELLDRCRGKTGPLSYSHKIWLSLVSNPNLSPSDLKAQLLGGASYPFVAAIDGYKETTITVNLTCVGPPPPPPPQFTVTGVTTPPVTYAGSCPANVQFKGTVNVNMTGGVQTRFEFSDGSSSPTVLYHVSAPGTTLSYTRQFTTSQTGYVRLHGNGIVSPNASYTITCKAPLSAPAKVITTVRPRANVTPRKHP